MAIGHTLLVSILPYLAVRRLTVVRPLVTTHYSKFMCD